MLWGSAHPSTPEPRYVRPAPKWDHFPIRVRFDGSWRRRNPERWSAIAGFQEWVIASNHRVSFTLVTTPPEDVLVVYGGRLDGSYTDTDVTRDGIALHCTTHLKPGLVWPDATERADYFQATAAHEFGHVLGIKEHFRDRWDLMNGYLDWPKLVSRADVVALAKVYEWKMHAGEEK